MLIQDYHFALLPRLIKEKRPDAHVALFWHIPWPNAEAFGICPWQTEILDGMLGADMIGFHTQFHCNNFLETVDRVVEARIDWEHFSVARGQHVTLVKPFPISVAPRFVDEPPATSRAALLQELGIDVEFLGVGVERIDYTKGLPGAIRRDRPLLHAAARVPGAPDIRPARRPEPEPHRPLSGPGGGARPARRADQRRAPSGSWRPIVLLKGHHDHRDVWPFYRWADFVMVTSLHDGMNLVAKEFVSVRDDGDGVLILSRFTGAARELRDAILVNPYDVDEMAQAIRGAIEMTPGERRAAWRGCARPCASTTSTAGPVSCSASSPACPARPISPTDPASGLGSRRHAVRLRPTLDPALRQLLRNAGWLLLSDGTVLVAGLLGTLVAARALGAQEFGRITLVWSVVGVAHLLVDVRAWEAVTRYLSEFTSRQQPALALATLKLALLAEGAVALLGFGLIWLASGWVSTAAVERPVPAAPHPPGRGDAGGERFRPDGSRGAPGVRPLRSPRALLGDRGGPEPPPRDRRGGR